MLVTPPRDHRLTAAWSAGNTGGPQVFLPGGDFFHQLHSSLARGPAGLRSAGLGFLCSAGEPDKPFSLSA